MALGVEFGMECRDELLDEIGMHQMILERLKYEAFQNVSLHAIRVVACARLAGGVDYVTAVTDRRLDFSYFCPQSLTRVRGSRDNG